MIWIIKRSFRSICVCGTFVRVPFVCDCVCLCHCVCVIVCVIVSVCVIVCVCVCVIVCVIVCVSLCVCHCLYVCMSLYVCLYIILWVIVIVCVSLCVYLLLCVFVCANVSTRIIVRICLYVYVLIFVCVSVYESAKICKKWFKSYNNLTQKYNCTQYNKHITCMYNITHIQWHTNLHTPTQNCQSITYPLKRLQTEKMKQIIFNMYLLRHKHTLIHTQ